MTKLRNKSAFTQMADLGGEKQHVEVSRGSDLRSRTVTVSSAATAAENKPVYGVSSHDV